MKILRVLNSNFKFILALTLAGSAWQECSAADFFFDVNVPVVRHDKRRSAHKFSHLTKDKKVVWGTAYTNRTAEEAITKNGRIISYQELPLCRKSEIVMREVESSLDSSRGLDLLYYDPTSKKQKRAVKKYKKPVIPYSPSLFENIVTKERDAWQQLARVIGLKCLPTRLHFVNIANKRFAEYRMGDAAWKDE